MVEPAGSHPPALRYLVDEAAELRERLHRVAIALSITEDMAADAFERLARDNGPGASAAMLWVQAQRARAVAKDCRAFAQHLHDIDHSP